MVAELRKNVPTKDLKDSLDETKEGATPVNITIRTTLYYPKDGITFRATPDFNGEPWFDFGFIHCDATQEGSMVDPLDNTKRRLLVRFWGFAKVKGVSYAFVDYFTRYRAPGAKPHPILKKYRFVPIRIGKNPTLPPFYCIKVASICASACVFPDPDKVHKKLRDDVVEQCLLLPSFVEICKGDSSKLPEPTLIAECVRARGVAEHKGDKDDVMECSDEVGEV